MREFLILYIIISLIILLLSSSKGHCRLFSIPVTTPGVWSVYELNTYRAAWRWTFSSDVLSFSRWGSQTLDAYSSEGRTIVVKVAALVLGVHCLKLRRKNPTFCLPLAAILSMCSDHVRLLDIVTPRYLLLDVVSMIWPCNLCSLLIKILTFMLWQEVTVAY